MTRKILYISGTRADYGLMRYSLRKIDEAPSLELEIIATGMHLMDEFGKTISEIEKDNFKYHIVDSTYKEDNKPSMAIFIGEFIELLVNKINEIQPDIILILGDRGEMLGGAIVGAYLSIPVAHIHGGDVSSTVDEFTRHAITKLSHLHLTATEKSAERIKKMGEEPFRVHVVGAPGLDSIVNEELSDKKDLAEKYNLEFFEPVVLVVQHPVSAEVDKAHTQMKETMEAIKDLKYQTVVVYPNADAGGRRMIDKIKDYEDLDFINTFGNIPRKDFLSLMKYSDVMVGNSSSGIIEAPSFDLPVVNLGSRQDGRDRASNVVDVDHDRVDIKKAIQKCISDKGFKKQVRNCNNPYGDGKASERIIKILNEAKINNKLLQKKLTY